MTASVPGHAYDCGCASRDRLEQAAPDMARVLLAIEWSGLDGSECRNLYRDEGDLTACCPACMTEKLWECVDHGKHGGAHQPDCPLDAALRKAGVR